MSALNFLNDDILTEELHGERLDDILIKLEDISNETNDSYGSCCSSPTESNNSGTASPSSLTSTDEEQEYFTFAKYPVKKCKSWTKKNADLTDIEKIRQKNETKVKRNIRERMRIKKLQDGFKKLQTVVPGDSKKLSKLDTLRYALDYIKTLTIMLQQHDQQMIEQQMQHFQGNHNLTYWQQTTIGPNMLPQQPWITHPLQIQYMPDFVPMIEQHIQPSPLWVMYQ